MAHFGQVWIYYAVVGGGMGTSSECASFFVLKKKKGDLKMFFFWPLLGVLIGISAAKAKGLGLAAGIIGGFLLGPLAFLMYLCSSDKKRCDFCQEWIEKRAKVCPFCTREVK